MTRICTLLLSLTLIAAPMQGQALAAMPAGNMPDSSHCPSEPAASAQVEPAGDVANCCCDKQCDSICQPDCSSHSVSALPLTSSSLQQPFAAAVYTEPALPAFSNSFTPPSPPPLV